MMALPCGELDETTDLVKKERKASRLTDSAARHCYSSVKRCRNTKQKREKKYDTFRCLVVFDWLTLVMNLHPESQHACL